MTTANILNDNKSSNEFDRNHVHVNLKTRKGQIDKNCYAKVFFLLLEKKLFM